jgi:quinol-cytochrome oxidoreductase complex cytochrome b subunit
MARTGFNPVDSSQVKAFSTEYHQSLIVGHQPAFGTPNVSLHAALRGSAHSAFERSENLLDAFFGGADNPLRHLGALGLFFLWILVASGLYLYTVLDTSIEGVYSSIGWLTQEQWYLGGVLRSLHRYASDAFVIVMFLHLLREWAYGRYHGFRLYSWVTGVPLIWLVFISGIGGYWIVWDRLAQFSAVATTELLDWLPIFDEPVTARNFLAPDSINDRFFTVLVFIHIGVPLMLILGLWAHVNRISRVDYLPTRRVMLATWAPSCCWRLIKPAVSDAPADLSLAVKRCPPRLVHPLPPSADRPDLAGAVWTLIFGATILLFALPFLPHPARQPIAVVDAPELQRLQPLPRRLPLRSDRHGAASGQARAQDRRRRCRPLRRLRHLRRFLPLVDTLPQPGAPGHRHRHAATAGGRAAPAARSAPRRAFRRHPAGGLRLRPKRRRRRPRGTRYRNAEPDLRRHAAALLRRIRPAQRRRRRGRCRLPRRRLRIPPRHGMDARAPDPPPRAPAAPAGAP